MEGEFPEQFKCPICLDIPKKEIFQCSNGHTLCDLCVVSLELCPQCRVSLGLPRIRSRPLEELLDMMKFDCSFKPEGCKTKVTRKDITSHSETCSFGGVSLCKYLGYTCCHKINTSNLHQSVQHLKQEHQCFSTTEPTLDITLKNLKNIDKKGRCLWKPVLMNNFSNHYLFVIFSFELNGLFSCISLGEEAIDKVEIKFNVISVNAKAPTLEWTTKPFSRKDSETLLNSPPFQFPLNLLVEKYLDGDDLKLKIILTTDNFRTTSQNKTSSITLDSFTVIKPLELDSARSSSAIQRSEIGFWTIIKGIQALHHRTLLVFNANCNVCRAHPLVGLRFKCLQCPDFDLCINCFQKKEHGFHYFAILCTREQETSNRNYCLKLGRWKPFVDVLEINSRNQFGSLLSEAMELHCNKCTEQPDVMCLQCEGLLGFCKFCFLDEMNKHDALHYFAFTPTNLAREFVLFILRK